MPDKYTISNEPIKASEKVNDSFYIKYTIRYTIRYTKKRCVRRGAECSAADKIDTDLR